MTVNNHVFPQSGDSDYAENFAAHLGRGNISDYVETGMDFTNLSGTSADVTKGKAFILKASSSVSDGSTRLNTDFAVHLPLTTVSLTDAAFNYIYLVPNTGTNDSASVTAYTDQTNAGTDDLLIGTIDTTTSPPTTQKKNRDPDVEVETLRSFTRLGIPVYDDVANANTGQGNVVFATGNGPSTQGLWVYDGSGWDYSGIQSLRDGDVQGVTGLIEDTNNNRPTAGTEGRLFFETDTQSIHYDTGSAWLRLALDASEITASDLGFNPATQTELDNHAGSASAHHVKTSTLDELADADVTELVIDTEANRPAAGTSNRVFIARDTGKIFHDSGTSWSLIGASSHTHLQNITADDHHTRYTDEEAQDAVNALLTAGNALGATYDDTNNALTLDVDETVIDHTNLASISTDDHHVRYSDEEAQDTVAAMLGGGDKVSVTYDDVNNALTIDTSALDAEEVEDRVNTLLAAGNAITASYDDVNGALTLDVQETAIDHTNLATVSSDDHHVRYSDEEAQDAVNLALSAGTALTKTYDDTNNVIALDVDAGNFADSYSVSDSGTAVLSDPTDINFGANITVTDDTDGTVTIDGVGDTDTHTDVSDGGTLVVGDVGDINFGTNITVTDDTDGTVTVDAQDSGDTRTDVSDNGTLVVSETGDINFSNALNVTDDTDGTVTVDVAEGSVSHDNLAGVSASDHHARPIPGNAMTEDTSGNFNVDETAIDHGNLAGVSSADHHARYTDEETMDAVNTMLTAGNALGATYDDVNNSLTLDVQETAIDHTNLATVSSDDHHARYSDEEAQDAVNLALSAGNALTKTYDDTNNTISVAVDETGISHDNIGGVSSSDHHTRYADSEARSAVTSASLPGGIDMANYEIFQGTDPADTITETGTPKGFTYSANEGRDIHTGTDVHVSNSTSSSVTENITVELYDGVDTTGTLLQSETVSISVPANSGVTYTFITNDLQLDTGSYYINVTQSGTTLAIVQTDEHTRGGQYRLDQLATGELYLRTQYGDRALEVNPITSNVSTSGSVNVGNDLDVADYASVGTTLDVGSDVDVNNIGTGASTFQNNAGSSGAVGAPWMYTAAVEAHTEKGGSSTLIELGSAGSTTTSDEISLITQGSAGLTVDSNTDINMQGNNVFNTGGMVLPVGTDAWV